MSDHQEIADKALQSIIALLGQAEHVDATLPFKIISALVGHVSFVFEDADEWFEALIADARDYRRLALIEMVDEAGRSPKN